MNKKEFLKWLKESLIRAIKSMAQTVIASIGTSSVVLTGVHWDFILMTTGMAGLISVLMSLERLPESNDSENKKTDDQGSP